MFRILPLRILAQLKQFPVALTADRLHGQKIVGIIMGFADIIQVGQHRVTVHLVCRFLVDGSTLLDVVNPDILHQF